MNDVDYKTGHCSKCGGTHYDTGNRCIYTDEEIKFMSDNPDKTLSEMKGPTKEKDVQREIPNMKSSHVIMEQPQSIAEEILCIYHSPCQDGFTAAWAMRHLMPKANIRFVPAKYGDPPPDVTNRIVYILDFSYSREITAAMLQVCKRLLILDHHESALKNLVGLDAGDPAYFASTQQQGAATEYHEGMKFWMSDKGSIVLDMSRSGAGMAWDYFAMQMRDPLREFGKKRPTLLTHVEDRDLWKFEYPETKFICASLFSYEQDFDTWDHLMEYGKTDLEALRDEGVGIMRKQARDINELLAKGTREFIIAGYRVPCCNLPYTLANEACHQLLEQYPEASFAASYMDMAHGRVFSLRSSNDRVNVSEVATQFTFKGSRGGGHRNAAGFTARVGWEGDEHSVSALDTTFKDHLET